MVYPNVQGLRWFGIAFSSLSGNSDYSAVNDRMDPKFVHVHDRRYLHTFIKYNVSKYLRSTMLARPRPEVNLPPFPVLPVFGIILNNNMYLDT